LPCPPKKNDPPVLCENNTSGQFTHHNFKLGSFKGSLHTKSLHRRICANTKGMGKNQGDCTLMAGKSNKTYKNTREKKPFIQQKMLIHGFGPS